MVERLWPSHPSVKENRERPMADLQECCRIADGPQRCGDTIFFLQDSDHPACDRVRDSRKLGRYMVKMMPLWVERFADRLPPQPMRVRTPMSTPTEPGQASQELEPFRWDADPTVPCCHPAPLSPTRAMLQGAIHCHKL
jgi:hypothetical protein